MAQCRQHFNNSISRSISNNYHINFNEFSLSLSLSPPYRRQRRGTHKCAAGRKVRASSCMLEGRLVLLKMCGALRGFGNNIRSPGRCKLLREWMDGWSWQLLNGFAKNGNSQTRRWLLRERWWWNSFTLHQQLNNDGFSCERARNENENTRMASFHFLPLSALIRLLSVSFVV